MSANIDANLANWSTTDGSNQPDGTDTADLAAEFQRLQSTVRKYLRTVGADIASAATVNLATATGDFVTITGSTGPITSLGTVSAGMRFILRFTGTPTITHHATSLILPTGVSINAVAGNIGIFESLGSGNWACVYFTGAAPIQTWQDMAGSRGLDSNYTNTTGYTISVVVVGTQLVGGGQTLTGIVGGASIFLSDSASGIMRLLPMQIPNGATYSVSSNSLSASVLKWYELR
jgi:hypothetical protein